MDEIIKLEWKDDWLVGNEELDEQHRFFVGLVNELTTEASRSEPREFARVLSLLTDFFLIHSKVEEEYMNGNYYPSVEEHREEHRRFIHQLTMYNFEFDHFLVPTAAEKLYGFVSAWFVRHELKIDMGYRNFVVRKNAD